MFRNILLWLLLLASPAYAETKVWVEEVDGQEYVAVIFYYNATEMGSPGDDVRTLELWGDSIMVEIVATPENCDQVLCPDTLHVLTLPVYLEADPDSVTVNEGSHGYVYLYERLIG